jgi:nitroreductase
VLIAIYANTYYPSGYHEYVFADYPKEDIEKLFRRSPEMQNIGAAVENMILTAVDLGYGACWMTGQNYAADEIAEVIRAEAGFEKEGYFLACMLAIGVPQEGAKSPPKKDLSEICTFL